MLGRVTGSTEVGAVSDGLTDVAWHTTPAVGQELSELHNNECSVMDVCSNCGMTEDERDGVVLGYHGESNKPMCSLCLTTLYEEETFLSGRESEVAALKEFGYSHNEIAELIRSFWDEDDGPSKSAIDEYSSRISEKLVKARRTTNELDWL